MVYPVVQLIALSIYLHLICKHQQLSFCSPSIYLLFDNYDYLCVHRNVFKPSHLQYVITCRNAGLADSEFNASGQKRASFPLGARCSIWCHDVKTFTVIFICFPVNLRRKFRKSLATSVNMNHSSPGNLQIYARDFSCPYGGFPFSAKCRTIARPKMDENTSNLGAKFESI